MEYHISRATVYQYTSSIDGLDIEEVSNACLGSGRVSCY